MKSMLLKTGLILTFASSLGCATRDSGSELAGSAKNLAGQKVYTCNYKVLYEKDNGKLTVMNKVRPLGIMPDKWQFMHDSATTKVTSEQCKKLSYILMDKFALEVGTNEQGFVEYEPRKVMAIYWQSNDATAAIGQHDSHGVLCSKSFADSEEKNRAYDEFGYSCHHEYMRSH